MPLPYGMNDGQLASIINVTSDHVVQMKSLNSRVQGQAEGYISANNSDSGRIMQEALFEWTDQFNKIVGDLEQLNTKVANVRQENQRTSHKATGAAHGAHT
jgi:hypothetical protein